MSQQNAAAILQTLRVLYQAGHLPTDLNVIVGSRSRRTFCVHKAMVSVFSDHFRQLLEEGQLNDAEYHLPDLEPEEMSILVDVMYTGELELTQENCPRVMEAARKLKMSSVIEDCQTYDNSSTSPAQVAGSEGETIDTDPSTSHSQIVAEDISTDQTKLRRRTKEKFPEEVRVVSDVNPVSPVKRPRGRPRKQTIEGQHQKQIKKVVEIPKLDTIQRRCSSRRSEKHLKIIKEEVTDNHDDFQQPPRKKSKTQTEVNDEMAHDLENDIKVKKLKYQKKIKVEESYIKEDSVMESSSNTVNSKKIKAEIVTQVDTELARSEDEICILVKQKRNRHRKKALSQSKDTGGLLQRSAQNSRANTFDSKSVRLTNLVSPLSTVKCPVCKKVFLHKSVCDLHQVTHGYVARQKTFSARLAEAEAHRSVDELGEGRPNKVFGGSVRMLNEQESGCEGAKAPMSGVTLGSPSSNNELRNTSSASVDEQDSKSPPNASITAEKDKIVKVSSRMFHKSRRVFTLHSQHKPSYRCRICGWTSPLYTLYKMHFATTHARSRSCGLCGALCTSRKAVLQHVRLAHSITNSINSESYHCHSCYRTFAHQTVLKKHVLMVHGTKVVLAKKRKRIKMCYMCGKQSPNLSDIVRHSCFPIPDRKENKISQLFIQKHKFSTQMIKEIQTKNKTKFICIGMCKKRFRTLYHARLHTAIRHQKSKMYKRVREETQTRLPCEEEGCDHVATNHTTLGHHMKAAHPGVEYDCPVCAYTSQIKTDIHVHHWKRHKEKMACEFCGKTFPKLSKLKLHTASAHGIRDPSLKEYCCEMEGCEYSTFLKFCLEQHMASHNPGKPYTCDICGKKLKTEANLIKHHKRIHLRIRPYICDQCGASYTEESELKSHMARHSVTCKFQCESCSYKSHDKGNLKSHMWAAHQTLMNHKQKLYVCDICSYTTSRKTRCMEHMNSHKNIRSYKCTKCDQSFITRSTLQSHNRWKHSEKSFKCEFCGHTTGTSFHLKEHVRIKHTHPHVKPYKCKYCNFRCATSGNCRKHIMNRHKGKEVTYHVVKDSSVTEVPDRRFLREGATNATTDEPDHGQNVERIKSKLQDVNVSEYSQASVDSVHVAVLHPGGYTQQLQLPLTLPLESSGQSLPKSAAHIPTTSKPFLYQTLPNNNSKSHLPEIEVHVMNTSSMTDAAAIPTFSGISEGGTIIAHAMPTTFPVEAYSTVATELQPVFSGDAHSHSVVTETLLHAASTTTTVPNHMTQNHVIEHAYYA